MPSQPTLVTVDIDDFRDNRPSLIDKDPDPEPSPVEVKKKPIDRDIFLVTLVFISLIAAILGMIFLENRKKELDSAIQSERISNLKAQVVRDKVQVAIINGLNGRLDDLKAKMDNMDPEEFEREIRGIRTLMANATSHIGNLERRQRQSEVRLHAISQGLISRDEVRQIVGELVDHKLNSDEMKASVEEMMVGQDFLKLVVAKVYSEMQEKPGEFFAGAIEAERQKSIAAMRAEIDHRTKSFNDRVDRLEAHIKNNDLNRRIR